MCVALLAAVPASATTYNWNFTSPTGTLGTSQVYTSNGVNITAYGYKFTDSNCGKSGHPACTATALYGKNAGGDEVGIGIANDPKGDNEISNTDFVQLKLTDLIATNPADIEMAIGSVQAGETWTIYGSNSQGIRGTALLSGSTDYPSNFDITKYVGTGAGQYQYISVSGPSGDVLVSHVGTTPEPASFLLLGSGILATWRIRKRKA